MERRRGIVFMAGECPEESFYTRMHPFPYPDKKGLEKGDFHLIQPFLSVRLLFSGFYPLIILLLYFRDDGVIASQSRLFSKFNQCFVHIVKPV